eukprot:scaffold55603_cov22-Tisochrysis_lutea.AAC.1
MYSLSSAANDNTRWYAYGAWDSMDDYRDHFYSSHVEELRNYLAKKVRTFFVLVAEVSVMPERVFSYNLDCTQVRCKGCKHSLMCKNSTTSHDQVEHERKEIFAPAKKKAVSIRKGPLSSKGLIKGPSHLKLDIAWIIQEQFKSRHSLENPGTELMRNERDIMYFIVPLDKIGHQPE